MHITGTQRDRVWAERLEVLDDSLLAEYSQHRSQLEEELDDESLLKAKVRVRDKSEN